MSNGTDLTNIRSITLSDTQDLMNIDLAAGSYEKRLENGVVIAPTIDNGKLVGYSARDKDGKALKVFHLQMSSTDAGDVNSRVCYVCYEDVNQDGSPLCFKIKCSQL